MPFENFDFSDFWENGDWADKAYKCEPPTDELIAEVEAELGCKLPESYIWLMKQHNGGIPIKDCYYFGDGEFEYFGVAGILGICKDGKNSPTFHITDGIAEGWGYPEVGVQICDCPSAGHDMIFLDYRECGSQGEPKVVHIDQESDYCITPVADNFEQFIRGLEENRNVVAERTAELQRLRSAEFSPMLSELCSRCDDPAATERWIRSIAEKIAEWNGRFTMYLEEDSLTLYDIQFWLYTNAYPNTTEAQYLADYEKILALGFSFDVDDSKPAIIKNWLKNQKERGLIIRKYDKRNHIHSVVMTEKAKKQFDKVFSTLGYSPTFVKKWLKQRKSEGIITEHDGLICMTDEAKRALIEKRNSSIK